MGLESCWSTGEERGGRGFRFQVSGWRLQVRDSKIEFQVVRFRTEGDGPLKPTFDAHCCVLTDPCAPLSAHRSALGRITFRSSEYLNLITHLISAIRHLPS